MRPSDYYRYGGGALSGLALERAEAKDRREAEKRRAERAANPPKPTVVEYVDKAHGGTATLVVQTVGGRYETEVCASTGEVWRSPLSLEPPTSTDLRGFVAEAFSRMKHGDCCAPRDGGAR